MKDLAQIPQIKPDFNPYFLALKDKRLTEMSEKDAKMHLAKVVTRSLNDLSHKMTEDDYKTFCNAAYQEVRLIFPQCTAAEFQMLCFNGIRGEYGDTIGISIVNLHKWIKGFLNSEQRQKAKKEMAALQQVEEQVDEEKVRADYIATIRKQFDHYKKTGTLNLTFPGVLYDELESQGLIQLTVEAKKVLFAQAKEKIIEKKKAARLKVSSVQRMEIVKCIERLEFDCENQADKSLIKIEAKTMAIKRYYDSINKFPEIK